MEIIELTSGIKVVILEASPGFYLSWNPNRKYLVYIRIEDGHDFRSLFMLDRGVLKSQRITFDKGIKEGICKNYTLEPVCSVCLAIGYCCFGGLF